MGLVKFGGLLEKLTSPASRIMNSAATGFIFAMMALVTVDVLLRYMLNRPIKGALEITEFFMVAVVFLSLAYTAAQRGHISVDIVVDRLPQRVQTVIDSIVYFISTGVFAVLTWRTVIHARYLWQAGHTTFDLGLPVFPMYYLAAFGCALLCLVCLVIFIQSLAKGVKK